MTSSSKKDFVAFESGIQNDALERQSDTASFKASRSSAV